MTTNHLPDPGKKVKTDAELIAIARKAYHAAPSGSERKAAMAALELVRPGIMAGLFLDVYCDLIAYSEPSTPIPDAVLDQAQDAEAALQSFGWPPPLAAYGQALDALAELRQARGK